MGAKAAGNVQNDDRHVSGWGTQRDDLLPGIRCFCVGNYVIFFRRRNPVEILRIVHGAVDFNRLRFAE